jgi:membrane protein implicated in regulation of membrane protease activity
MLIYAYVFALVLGAVLLGSSFLLGGDGDADADVDVDADAEVDSNSDSHGDLGGLFGVLGSMRFWTFFAAFFGLTGVILDGLDLAAELVALVLAVAVGLATGWVAVTLLNRLSANDTGVAAGIDDYVGKSGEMLIAAGPGRLGKIRIELKGTTVDVLAESDEQTIDRGHEALIVDMRGSKAIVVKLDSARQAAAHA